MKASKSTTCGNKTMCKSRKAVCFWLDRLKTLKVNIMEYGVCKEMVKLNEANLSRNGDMVWPICPVWCCIMRRGVGWVWWAEHCEQWVMHRFFAGIDIGIGKQNFQELFSWWILILPLDGPLYLPYDGSSYCRWMDHHIVIGWIIIILW